MTDPVHEFFPVQSTPTADQEGVLTGGVVSQLDLTELSDKLAPRLADPDSAFTESDVVKRPDAAAQTVGPHRYTIYVPYDDKTRVNFGAPHPLSGETGVTVDTLTHIHLATWGATPTYFSLGAAPVNQGAATNKATAGYSLHTHGASAHISELNLSMSSKTGSMTLTASTQMELFAETANLNLKSGGDTSVTADKLVLISAGKEAPLPTGALATIGAAVLTIADVADFLAPAAGMKSERAEKQGGAAAGAVNFFLGDMIENDAAALRDAWVAKSASVVDKVMTHMAATVAIFLGYKKTKKEAEDGKGTWKSKTAWGSWVVSILAEYNALKVEFDADNTEGDIRLKATKKIMMDAAGGVSINGAKGVSISGFKGASMTGLTSTIKGHKEAGVWGGFGASVKSLAGGVTISSDLKGVEVTGKKEVKLNSEADKASLTGNLDVQLNSVTAKALIHGPTAVHVVAGSGDGFGMVAKADKVEIGAVTSAKDFASAASDAGKTSALFDASQVRLQSTADSKLTITKNGVTIKTKAAGINSSGKIYLKGSIVELN